METLLDILTTGVEPFIWHPERAYKVSLIFWAQLLLTLIIRARRPQVRALPPLVAALAWVAFGLLERSAYEERANIRIDLIITWPGLWLLTGVCCVVWLYSLVARRAERSKGRRPFG